MTLAAFSALHILAVWILGSLLLGLTWAVLCYLEEIFNRRQRRLRRGVYRERPPVPLLNPDPAPEWLLHDDELEFDLSRMPRRVG